MKVIKNEIPRELSKCANCGRRPKFLAVFRTVDRPHDAEVKLCAECLNDGQIAVRDAFRADAVSSHDATGIP